MQFAAASWEFAYVKGLLLLAILDPVVPRLAPLDGIAVDGIALLPALLDGIALLPALLDVVTLSLALLGLAEDPQPAIISTPDTTTAAIGRR
jgi:hypothetical protein